MHLPTGLTAVTTAVVASLASTVLADDLFWGPYRPNVYLGMRPRVPESLMTGLMWFASDSLEGIRDLRHDCNMGDNVVYGWDHYDSRKGGVQTIEDVSNKVNLTTSLVKSDDGSNWIIRVKGDQAPSSTITVIHYAALEGLGDLDLASKFQSSGYDAVELRGSTPDLGSFSLTVTEGSGTHPQSDHPEAVLHPADRAQHFSLRFPGQDAWRARDIFLTLAQDRVTVMSEQYGETSQPLPAWALFQVASDKLMPGNIHYVQKTYEGPFEFDIVFKSSGDAIKFDKDLAQLKLDQKIKFENAYKLQAPFDKAEYEEFSRKLVSNIEAGIGYFYGDSLVGQSENPKAFAPAPAHELFTCTPTRSFFPRGFYWDEGFHLLGLVDYDLDLVLEILSSWFSTMDDDGWIAREQILGAEARSRVPPEFQVQFPDYANPPTMIMLLAHLGTSKPDAQAIGKLRELYPELQRHFKWFRETQRGDLLEYDREAPGKNEAYRWRGRSPTHVLTSGFDDYPRALEPSDGELHVDLLSWVGAMARSLHQIADILGFEDDSAKYAGVEKNVRKNLDALHWSNDDRTFCDVTVNEFEEDEHVCHKGYVSHLPLFLQLLDPSDEKHLLPLLQQLRNSDQLWSEYGIRSLAKDDEFFGTAENYWRGPVWININYLALESLAHYAVKSPSERVRAAATLAFNDLRKNVVDNVYEQWKKTGTVWEQYDSLSGATKGAKQFTGWTALVAKIMCMPELDSSHDEL